MKTLLLILATTLSLFAADSGSVLVYNGVADRALATNVLKVTGGTNATLAGGLSLHSLNSTGSVTAASFEASGDVSGSLLALPDDDGSHFFTIEAAGTTTTSVNIVGPAAPFTGLLKATASGTNWVLSAAVAGVDYKTSSYYTIPFSSSGGTVGANTYYIGPLSGFNIGQGRYNLVVPVSGSIVGYTIFFRTSTATTEPTGNTVDVWLNNAQVPGGQYAWTFVASSTTSVYQSTTPTAVVSGDLVEVRLVIGGSPSAAILSQMAFQIVIAQ